MMKAVRYHGPDVAFTFEDIPKPEAGAGEVLVEVKAAALCHTELHFADGTLNLGVKPITMGHEAAGIIVAVGAGVPAERVGERVVVYYYVGCGGCRWCVAGEEALCDALTAQFGFISDGGLAQFLKAPARNAVPLPDTLSFEAAAPIGCGVTTAVHACRLAGVAPGDWVAVYGVNGVGFGLVQLLKHRGAKVIAITRSEQRRTKARELGADVTIDATDATTVAAAVRAATGGAGCDVIFECVGRRETMDACVGWVGALGKRGRLVFVGYTAGEQIVCKKVSSIPFCSVVSMPPSYQAKTYRATNYLDTYSLRTHRQATFTSSAATRSRWSCTSKRSWARSAPRWRTCRSRWRSWPAAP